jgi:hypothetical protein|tara:strand:- start:2118 stop:2897 length:780 start_codon:yes stop_codon:yes gene_type:complete
MAVVKSCKVKDYDLEVSRGNISDVGKMSKFGRGTNYDPGDVFPLDVWGTKGIYTGQPTGAAETMEIYSSSANDTSAGTGARTVEISNILDGTGADASPVQVTLSGSTPVSLGAGTYSRATKVTVLTAGSTGANEGVITLRHTTTTANVFATLPVGYNQTQIACYTVPLNKELHINRANVLMSLSGGGNGSANITIRSRPYGGVYNTRRNAEITNGQGYAFENNGYMIFEAREDIVVRVESVSDNNTIVTAELDGYLIDV